MLEKLDFMVRFWQLRARHDAMGAPLSSSERLELLSLLRWMAGDDPLPGPGPAPKTDGLPVQLTAPGGFVAAELRAVSAEGIVITCAVSGLRRGAATIVRLADAVSGVEYELPCVVEWTHPSSPCSIGLRVDGAPTRRSFSIPEPGMWSSPLKARDPLAAWEVSLSGPSSSRVA